MADSSLDTLARQLDAARLPPAPPLQSWHPALSGDIDIVIDRQGRWYHEGDQIRREALVRLFASILRREEDGCYYLVTPVEKWRIRVEALPLIVTDLEPAAEPDQAAIALLNTGGRIAVSSESRLFMYRVSATDEVAALSLPHGLSALFSRAAWLRLVDQATVRDGQLGLVTAGQFFVIGQAA